LAINYPFNVVGKLQVIKIKDLTKKYYVPSSVTKSWGKRLSGLLFPAKESVNALNGISFEVQKGEIVGYLGPNGAGKSTTMKILTGILTPTSGEVDVLGYIPYKDRYKCSLRYGVLFGQRTLLWFHIPVIESLKLYKDIYEISDEDFTARIRLFSELLEIDRLLHIPVRKLSLGERMRCEIVAALIHMPEIIFLDEPTIGLDILAKDKIRGFLEDLNKAEGTTIFLSTHDMSEVERLCKRAIIIDKGNLIYDGTLDDLKGKYANYKILKLVYYKIIDQHKFDDIINANQLLHSETCKCDLLLDARENLATNVIQDLAACCEIKDIALSDPSLEEVLIKIYRGMSVAERE